MFESIKAALYVSVLSAAGAYIFYVCATPDLKKRFGRIAIFLSVFVPVIAFLSPSLLIYDVIVALIVPVVAKRRELIAPVYLFSYLTLPLVDSILHAGGFYFLTYNAAVSLGLGALVALMIRSERSPPRNFAHHIPFLIFFVVFTFANARDTSFTNVVRVSLDLSLQVALPYFVICKSVRNVADFKLAIAGLAAAMVSLAVVACFEALRTWPLYRVVWFHFGDSMSGGAGVKLRGGLLRSPGPYPEPTQFGFCLALGLVAIYAAKGLTKSFTGRAVILAVVACGVVMPQSRGAWFGVIIGLLAVDAFKANWSALGRNAGIMVGGGAALLAASVVSSKVANILGLSAEGRGTYDYRRQLFDRGLEEIQKAPLFGDSIPNVLYKLRDMRQGEGIVDFVNAYIYIALISGLVGLALIVGAWLFQSYSGWNLRNRFKRGEDRSAAAFGFAAIMSMMLMFTGTAISGRNTGMLAVAMGLITALATSRERSARPAPQVNPVPVAAGA